MRLTTKVLPALLVLAFAMSAVPHKAGATLLETLIDLTDPNRPVPPQAPVRLALCNNTGMRIAIELWTSDDKYIRTVYLAPGDEWRVRSNSWLSPNIEYDLYVLKPKRGVWMYYDVMAPPSTSLMIVDAVKWGKSDFGFHTLMIAR